MVGDLLLLIATLAILHAAYSTYEHLSHLKSLGRPEGSLPSDIVVETLVALAFGIIGSVVRTPALREITWRSEMKRRRVSLFPIYFYQQTGQAKNKILGYPSRRSHSEQGYYQRRQT
ncbi:hypothetical protein EIP91_003165 [Steccherinum ochraceum]|uniref:Membrane magnesium transporter n=1 Tax=Steccherinum ochraceum TaxID=92696 RepID=A0A4R0RWW8_9APHY|nr:hypothetical protein EIP91_003165 [Steccherinum ochraceum]